MYALKIPDNVFADLAEKAIVADKRGFIKFNQKRYVAYCTDQTKQWVDSTGYEPKFVGFFVKQNQHEIVIGDCVHCGKQLTEKDVLLGHVFCSHYCQTQSDQRKQNAKQTNIEKYGVDIPTKNPAVIQKRKQTCLEKYGAQSVVQSDYFKQKSKQTLLENYGVDAPFKSEQIRQKAKQSLINNIGVDNPFKLEQYQQQARDTRREKYGVEYYSQTDEHKTQLQQFYATKDDQYWEQVAEKKKQTNLERYGTEYSSSAPEIIEKIKQTNLERYGATSYTSSDQWIRERKTRQYDKFTGDLKSKAIELLTTKTNIVNTYDDITLKCNICGSIWTLPQTMCAQDCVCPNCAHELRSYEEKQFAEYIKSLVPADTEVVENERSVLNGKELDLYIPSLKLAFEFNGNYWHSDACDRIDRNYHLQKTIMCAHKDIRLVHIFEYQWKSKRKQVEMFIQSLLCAHPTIVYARKCDVVELTNDEFNLFVDNYHMQGAVNCSTRLGLFYNRRLIAVVGFSRSRFKQDEVELVRYCTLPNYRIIGGLAKLVNHSPFNNIVSYVDYSHYNGQGFINAGFELIDRSKPNYVWISGADRIYSRYQTQKHNLANILHEEFDPNLSETENMRNAGFNRLFDCGNLKFKWTRKA